jgi:Group XII secretory phospholipase A2 precursor (PLA2G12)
MLTVKCLSISLQQLYTSTKEDWNQDVAANFGTLNIFPNRVARGDPGTTNGCGPESSWPGINDVATYLTGFGDQCNNHDLCYNKCGVTQASCDEEFRDMMISDCNDYWDSQSTKAACIAVANGMYGLVRDYGYSAFAVAQAAYNCP